MLGGEPSVDRAEQIKWWNALDALPRNRDVERALEMARECQPMWLASLFPRGASVTLQHMLEVMQEQGEDPRALFIVCKLERRELLDERRHRQVRPVRPADANILAKLLHAAVLGYAPAQALLCYGATEEEKLVWAQWANTFTATHATKAGRSSCIGRLPLSITAQRRCRWDRWRIARTTGRGIIGGAANRCGARSFWGAVERMVPEFEDGQSGRILHTVAPFIKAQLDLSSGEVYGCAASVHHLWMLARVVMLHENRCSARDGRLRAGALWGGGGEGPAPDGGQDGLGAVAVELRQGADCRRALSQMECLGRSTRQ
jgi:hypothetical protein